MDDELPTVEQIKKALLRQGFKTQYYGGVQIGYAGRPYAPEGHHTRAQIEERIKQDVLQRLLAARVLPEAHCQQLVAHMRLYGIHIPPFEPDEWDPCQLSEDRAGWCPLCTYVYALLPVEATWNKH